MARKRFPNGFASWQETHYEVVSFMALELQRDFVRLKVLLKRHEAQGTGGMYELAEELTDKFEKMNKDRFWDGEFFDEIENFLIEELS